MILSLRRGSLVVGRRLLFLGASGALLLMNSAGAAPSSPGTSGVESPDFTWGSYEPANERMKPRPAWEVDVTESLMSPGSDGKLQPFSSINDRAARALRVKGGELTWSANITVPANAEPSWPLVLEADESRVIQALSWNGDDLPSFNRAGMGDLWSSGEGSILLPPTEPGSVAKLTLDTRDVPQVATSGFGRLRLRPATLDEALRLQRPSSNGAVEVVNESAFPIAGTLYWVQEDCFGAPLKEGSVPFNLEADARASLAVDAPANGPGVYKTRYRLVSGDRRSLEYWNVVDMGRTQWMRPHALRLNSGWEFVFTPGDLAKTPPPADGWKTIPSLPFNPSGSEYSSHWMWVRNTFTLPADWPAGQQLEIFLPSAIRNQGRVLLDGREVAVVGSWDLPARIIVPGPFAPGSKHTIAIGITDYIVGLASGVKAPESGPMEPVGRGLDAPIGATHAMSISFDCVPEILPVPATRVDAVKIATQGDQLSGNVTIVGTPGRALQLAGTVLNRGRSIGEIAPQTVTIGPDGRAAVTLTQSFPGALRWDPEHPVLHELRLNLTEPTGTTLDTIRARFGFREIGIKDGHYVLNGSRVNLLGGSHVYITNMDWPVYAHPYRLMRHGYNGAIVIGGGTASGMAAINAADEMGYLLKTADWSVNAHCADNYAWQSPLLWERLRATWRAATSTYANNPSIIIWDVANEVTFRGKDEDRLMGELLAYIRKIDPTRLATIGGSFPHPANAEILNFHGWGEWSNRADYFFEHPEERPSYLKNAGYFARKPVSDSGNWTRDVSEPGSSKQLTPGVSRDLRHIDNVAPFFAEGHYYESSLPVSLMGHDAFLRQVDANDWYGYHGLNILATRNRSITNVRQAGIPASMIHVDRGVGRAAFPLAAFPWERQVRFRSGEPIRIRFGIHCDLVQTTPVVARFRLFDGAKLLGEKTISRDMAPGSIELVDLDFPAVTAPTDKSLRLEVRVGSAKGAGWFADDIDLTIFAAETYALPAGQSLDLFDPSGNLARFLQARNVAFTPLVSLADWKPAKSRTLLIAPEALVGVAPAALAQLGRGVTAGGRVIVLNHAALPKFLRAKLVQNPDFNSYSARLDYDSPVLRGLTTEDLRAWNTREKDQIVTQNPLDVPSYGNFRVHASTVRSAPVLEVGEGDGRVLFVQMNLEGALGLDPAAARLFGNLLRWTGQPSPFGRVPTLLVTADATLEGTLSGRFGLEAKVSARPTAKEVDQAAIIIVSGREPAAQQALEPVRSRVLARVNAGATLLVPDLDDAGAEWLSKFLGTPVRLTEFPHRYGYLVDAKSPVTAGLGHGDLFTDRLAQGMNPKEPAAGSEPLTARFVISGEKVKPLSQPANLAEIPVGRGRVILCEVQAIASPMPGLARVLSTILGNAGARLDPEGSGKQDQTAWKFQPIDLTRFVNRPLADSNQPGARRGWNASGEENDLRTFPTGRQNLRGVDYLITPPESGRGNSFIALAAAENKLGPLPREVKGIPVNAKADRLYFLHTAVWGEPGFVYRVYYKEDRAVWIPGKPDPFVDVFVKPGENIADWVYAGAVERGERFMAGATVAWQGGTPMTRRASATGATDVGVFQMVWDNPHPEKTIESIDILSPGKVGGGHPFVFGITAAQRGTPVMAPAPLKDVLPEGVRPERVLHQARFPRYGYVLLNDGTIGSIYDRKGRPFASSKGWVMESFTGGSGQPTVTTKLAGQSRQKPQIQTTEEGGRVQHVIRGDLAEITYQATITATPGGLRYELEYTPKVPAPAGARIRVSSVLDLRNASTKGVQVNEAPVPIVTPDGTGAFNFDLRYLTWVFSYFVADSQIGLVSPPKNGSPYAPGQKESLWWEVTPP